MENYIYYKEPFCIEESVLIYNTGEGFDKYLEGLPVNIYDDFSEEEKDPIYKRYLSILESFIDPRIYGVLGGRNLFFDEKDEMVSEVFSGVLSFYERMREPLNIYGEHLNHKIHLDDEYIIFSYTGEGCFYEIQEDYFLVMDRNWQAFYFIEPIEDVIQEDSYYNGLYVILYERVKDNNRFTFRRKDAKIMALSESEDYSIDINDINDFLKRFKVHKDEWTEKRAKKYVRSNKQVSTEWGSTTGN